MSQSSKIDKNKYTEPRERPRNTPFLKAVVIMSTYTNNECDNSNGNKSAHH